MNRTPGDQSPEYALDEEAVGCGWGANDMADYLYLY
jgi:hypothetical protein